MRFTRLEVESFKCVEQAQVEFGPGLNVLFGANDLGKSSLGEAIRAALLLPATSSDRKAFEAWGATQPPRVRLVFARQEHLWRIDKAWGEGTRGTALLERSADGHVWSKAETGRSVDAELRKMLGWGVREPGGKAAPKGLPKSFITTALLGANSRIEELFAEDLGEDSDPAGRERLSGALQSLAEDPLFKRILAEAQARVDRSKDSRGNWRRGREAPLGRIAERIREVSAQYEGLLRQAEQNESVHEVLRTHQDRRTALLEQLDALRTQRVRLQAEYDAGAVWREAQAATQAARSQLESIDHELARVDGLRAEADAARATVGVLIEHSEVASGGLAQAQRVQLEATEALALLERDDGAQARVEELRRHELTLQRDLQRVGERRRQLVEALALDATAGVDARQATAAVATGRRAQQELDLIHGELAALDRELEQVGEWVALLRWRDATAVAERAELATTTAKSLAARARLLREAATRRRAELDRTPIPDAQTLEVLREMDARLRRAEDQAAVGFAVTFRLADGRSATVAADGGAALEVADTTTHPALRDMTVAVAQWGSLQIEAGSAAMRSELATARARWLADGAPILAAHGAANLEALVLASTQWHELSARCQQDEQQASALDREAAAGAVDEAALAAARAGLAAATDALHGADPARVAELATQLGERSPDDVLARHAQLHSDRAARRDRLAKAELERGLAVAQVEQLRLAAEASANKADAARRGLPADLVTAGAECEDELAAVVRAVAQVEANIQGAAQRGQLATADARGQLETATLGVANAKAQQVEVERKLTTAREHAAATRARADEAAARLATVDRDAAAAALERCLAHSARLTPPTAVFDADAASTLATEIDRLEHQLRDTDAEIQKAEGSLEQIGGATMRRRADESHTELVEAKQAEADLQREYDGWQLLRDTLREVETEQGQHLGNALGGAVEARLRQLTGGRYARLELDRNLKANGLRIGGSARSIEVLSAGLKEQLATLVRLAIAEHLDTAVILDDHLAQTDPDRVEFFRSLLREVSERVQVIVLTCRPLDYLSAAELPGAGVMHDVVPTVRAIDLGRVIVRGTAAGP